MSSSFLWSHNYSQLKFVRKVGHFALPAGSPVRIKKLKDCIFTWFDNHFKKKKKIGDLDVAGLNK